MILSICSMNYYCYYDIAGLGLCVLCFQRQSFLTFILIGGLFVLRFYGPVNPMGSYRARSVYLTTRLLGRLSPLSEWVTRLTPRAYITIL